MALMEYVSHWWEAVVKQDQREGLFSVWGWVGTRGLLWLGGSLTSPSLREENRYDAHIKQLCTLFSSKTYSVRWQSKACKPFASWHHWMPRYYRCSEIYLLSTGVQSDIEHFAAILFTTYNSIGKINSEAFRNAGRSTYLLEMKWNTMLFLAMITGY